MSVLALWLGQSPAEARQAPSTRAVVFIRVFGDIEADADTQALPVPRPAVSRKNVQVSTGTGFVFSSFGQILTCYHVVADSDQVAVIGGRRGRVRTTVRRIEVQFVRTGDVSMPFDRLEATVVASNPDLDLAVLSVAATDAPTLDFGDSDALTPGEPLDAVGFPFGEDVEIARQLRESGAAPEPTVSRGNFSAFRGDNDGARRFLQTTAAVNPGNSGGPILDRDGYVVGVIARRLTGTSAQVVGIGFAVPINVVKEFLESRGLDGPFAAAPGARRTSDVRRQGAPGQAAGRVLGRLTPADADRHRRDDVDAAARRPGGDLVGCGAGSGGIDVGPCTRSVHGHRGLSKACRARRAERRWWRTSAAHWRTAARDGWSLPSSSSAERRSSCATSDRPR